ncbi:MAG: insulinase family protein [Phycisphaerales bacterium]|nr:insulinase family protein [Phycisphaerales bacterium]
MKQVGIGCSVFLTAQSSLELRMHKSGLASLALAACLLPAFMTPSARAQQVQPEVFVLNNGMKFLLLARHDQPNVITAGWVAKVGSVNERPGITGISHFFEHIMFKGTDTIGTRNPKLDADYRARQSALRAQINDLIWNGQYARYYAGEIDDPWNPNFDTPEIATLRKELKALMDTQQGRAFSEKIAAIEMEVKRMGDGAETQSQRSALEGEIAQMKSTQTEQSSIVKDEFDLIYTGQGGSGMNAFTTNDVTFYFINIPSNKFELWAWMESDRLQGSVFREFYSERDVVHEERRLRTESTPTGVFQEQFDAMFWMASGYSWPVIGWTSDLNSYTMEEALKYWNTYYRPNNLCGVIVGDFDPGEVRVQIERYFSRLERGGVVPPVVTLEVPQLAEQRMIAECECQPAVEVRYHSVPFGHKDGYALDVLSSILNGRTGRLYKGLVEGREIASSAQATQEPRKYAGAFSFNGEVKGDHTPGELEQAWKEEVLALQNELVPALELQKVKNQAAAENYRRLRSNYFLLVQLVYLEALCGWEEINTGPAKIAAVTAEDIQRVAKKYLSSTNSSVATYTRKAGSQASVVEDPELAALPPQMQQMVKGAMKKIAAETDAEKLRSGVAELTAQASQVPPPMKPAFDYILKKMIERLNELDNAAPAAAPAAEGAAQ